MKKLLVVLTLALFAGLFFAGCPGDDCSDADSDSECESCCAPFAYIYCEYCDDPCECIN